MYGGRVAQLGPGCGKMKNVKNAKMGYQIPRSRVLDGAKIVPGASPMGVSPEVCTLLGVTEPMLHPP